jgi:site-specific DNA-methyltransferase (adenine-specific)
LVERLSTEIKRARADAGLSLAEIGQAMQEATDGQYGAWYHRGGHMFFETGRSLPSRPEWERLRNVLPIRAEFADVYAEAERQVLRETKTNRDGGSWAEQVRSGMFQTGERIVRETAPATDAARQWQGWGTALKPAFEPVVVARKPLTGTVAATIQQWGTGALNIDGCRVPTSDPLTGSGAPILTFHGDNARPYQDGYVPTPTQRHDGGRWPTNVLLDGDSADRLDAESGTLTSGKMQPTHTTAARQVYGQNAEGGYTTMETYGDTGGASRFFPVFRYQAKAPTRERVKVDGIAHPTVKPLALMRWLVRLVTPPGGVVLEPFAGSGTTVEAAILEGFQCIAIEREADYLPLILQRIERNRITEEGVPAVEVLTLWDDEESA